LFDGEKRIRRAVMHAEPDLSDPTTKAMVEVGQVALSLPCTNFEVDEGVDTPPPTP